MAQSSAELPEITKRASWTRHQLNNGPIFSATYHLVRTLPLGMSHGIGRAGTWLACKMMRRLTAAVEENLRLAFPALSDREVRDLALATYRSYARDTVDLIHCAAQPREALLESFEAVDTRPLDKALAGGRGLLLITGHFGNWEMGALLLGRLYGYPLTVVGMAEESDTINRRRELIRRSFGVDTIAARQSLDTPLRIRRLLAANRLVALLVDRYAGKDRTAVQFFDRQAYFLRTPALMACLSGAPLLPVAISRGPTGRFVSTIGAPIEVDVHADSDDCISRATQACATFFEAQIRLRPETWYQFYRYWPTQELVTDRA